MGKVKAMFRRKQHRKKRFTGLRRPKDISVDGSSHSFEDQELHKMERLLGMKKKSSLSSEFTKDGLDCIQYSLEHMCLAISSVVGVCNFNYNSYTLLDCPKNQISLIS